MLPKRLLQCVFGVLVLAGFASAHAGSVTYTMDPSHTDVVATWNHFGYSHPNAMFRGITGTLTYDPEHPDQASVQATIPVASVHTASDKLDEHLQGADFFDAAKWPNITFKSTSAKRGSAADTLEVTGNLTIHGVTRPVTLNVTVNKLGAHPMSKAPTAAFNATATIKRSDFGVKLYVPMVSDEISLRMTTEAIEAEAFAAMQQE